MPTLQRYLTGIMLTYDAQDLEVEGLVLTLK